MYGILFFLPILAAVILSFSAIGSRVWQGVWITLLIVLIFWNLNVAGVVGAVLTIVLTIKMKLPERRDF
jgi:hypothetical protein